MQATRFTAALRHTMYLFTLFLFAGAVAILPATLTAQTVSGTVYDAETGNPLPGAAVLQADTQNGTFTDSRGSFTLTLRSPGSQSLQVRFIGYEPQTILLEGQDLSRLSITLEPGAAWSEAVFVEDVRARQRSPFTQTTVPKALIDRDNVGQDPIFTLERLTPSVLTHSDSGTRFANYSYMRLRGMDQSRINMTLNGIPLNDMIDQGVFFSNFNDFGNSIQSVQVQRGVGTSTNGTASYAGSVNFESQNITMDEPTANLKLAGGAFNSYRVSSEVQTGAMGNFGFYTRFSQTESDGYRFNSGSEATSFFVTGGYFGERDIVKVTAFSGRTKNELAYTPVPIDDIRNEPRTNTLSPNDEDDFSQEFLQLQYGRQLSDRLQLTTSLYYGGAGGDFPVGFPDGDGNFVQQVFALENDHYGLLSSAQYADGGGFEISGGIHAYRFDRINEEWFSPESENPFYSDSSQKDEFSAFVKSSVRLGDVELYGDVQFRAIWLRLRPDLAFLQAGGVNPQNASIPTREWTFLSPKAGVTWFLSDRVNLYTSFGRSGREPTRQDILGAVNINPSNLAIAQDSRSVRAEFVNNLEGGVRFQTSRFDGKLNGFYMQFRNEISPTGDFIPEGFVQIRENIRRSNRTGVEAEWTATLHNRLTFSGNATWMTSNVEEFSPGGSGDVFFDREAILTPNWLFNGTLTAGVVSWADVELTGRYMGEAFLELTNRPDLVLPSFFVTDLGVHTTLTQRISASAVLHNLFDKLYFTNGAPVDANFDGMANTPGFIVQPPRHLFVELSVRL
ncbi:MAG: TonB-dependent receptor [Balneolaceae bacterium]